MTVTSVSMAVVVRVRVTFTQVRDGMKEYVSQEASEREREQDVSETLASFAIVQEEHVHCVDQKDWND